MDEFRKDTSIFEGKGESDGNWITMPNGAKVFVPKGMTKEDAVNAHFEKQMSLEDKIKNLTNLNIQCMFTQRVTNLPKVIL